MNLLALCCRCCCCYFVRNFLVSLRPPNYKSATSNAFPVATLAHTQAHAAAIVNGHLWPRTPFRRRALILLQARYSPDQEQSDDVIITQTFSIASEGGEGWTKKISAIFLRTHTCVPAQRRHKNMAAQMEFAWYLNARILIHIYVLYVSAYVRTYVNFNPLQPNAYPPSLSPTTTYSYRAFLVYFLL